MKILLVEDDDGVLNVYGRIIQNIFKGSKVLTACSINEAREIILDKGDKPDLVIIDYQLPDGKGTNILKLKKQFDFTFKVIIISGLSATNIKDMVLRDGADGFLPKPFMGEELKRLIDQILSD